MEEKSNMLAQFHLGKIAVKMLYVSVCGGMHL